MQGHGDYNIEALIEGDGAEEVRSQGVTEGFDTGVFEEMDEIFEGSFVVAVGVGGVVAGKAGTAASADPMVVERRLVEEWGAALGAKVIGRQRSGRSQAGLADRNPAGVPDRLAAYLAVLGEYKVEQGREGPPNYGRKERSVRIGYGPFREDPPPKIAVYNIVGLICYDPGTYAQPPQFSCFRRSRRGCSRPGTSGERDFDFLR